MKALSFTILSALIAPIFPAWSSPSYDNDLGNYEARITAIRGQNVSIRFTLNAQRFSAPLAVLHNQIDGYTEVSRTRNDEPVVVSTRAMVNACVVNQRVSISCDINQTVSASNSRQNLTLAQFKPYSIGQSPPPPGLEQAASIGQRVEVKYWGGPNRQNLRRACFQTVTPATPLVVISQGLPFAHLLANVDCKDLSRQVTGIDTLTPDWKLKEENFRNQDACAERARNFAHQSNWAANSRRLGNASDVNDSICSRYVEANPAHPGQSLF